MTKIIRSPFNKEVGGIVEGCTILEKTVIIPPNPAEQRRGIYDYLVEVPPAAMKAPGKAKSSKAMVVSKATEPGSFTRATPDEMGAVIRRVGRR
ncbi:MAG: hypothetical protein JWP63_3155 [Candidatus Solibacter sp.]|jgi:hypothetical protein|nr:hypothetical protein [Candidatus Solibacter sp.]